MIIMENDNMENITDDDNVNSQTLCFHKLDEQRLSGNVKIGNDVFYWSQCKKQFLKLSQEKVNPETIFCGLIDVKGNNLLQNFDDLAKFDKAIYSICDLLGLKKTLQCRNLTYLIRYVANSVFQDKIKVVNWETLETINEACAGGCLVAKAGIYDGEFTCYDINNSYNAFFIDRKFPSNPRFATIQSLEKILCVQIYRCKIDEKCITDELHKMLKLKRLWFTGFDLKVFDEYNIKYELVQQENNTILFDFLDLDFDFLEKVNELKQKTDKKTDIIKYTTYKTFLSGFWGVLCQYLLVTEDKEKIDHKYFHQISRTKGVKLYKKPIQLFKFSCAVAKPFIMAYARFRLLTQIKKCESKGYKVVYCHTDSIVTDAKPKLFVIGKGIGEWKVDKITEKGIDIKNIATKFFLE